MKIRLAYWDISKYLKNGTSDALEIRHAFEILDATENLRRPYSKYLLSTLDSDFFENRHKDYDLLLAEIKKLEDGELNNFYFEFDGFIHYVGGDSVTFEHAIFGVCPHWPLWSCPLSHYKIAVQAARDFFAMPVSLDTELIVELPDSDMAKIILFPPVMMPREASLDLKQD